MAARRPVVSSAIGGTDELIEDGAERPARRAGRRRGVWRRRCGACWTTPALRARSLPRARERVERDFTPAAMAGRVEAIYAELLAE